MEFVPGVTRLSFKKTFANYEDFEPTINVEQFYQQVCTGIVTRSTSCDQVYF